MIRERFGGLVNPAPSRARERFPVPGHPETRVSVVTDVEATSSSVSIYLKHEPIEWTTVGSYRRWLVETLATGMLVNRINERSSELDSPFVASLAF